MPSATKKIEEKPRKLVSHELNHSALLESESLEMVWQTGSVLPVEKIFFKCNWSGNVLRLKALLRDKCVRVWWSGWEIYKPSNSVTCTHPTCARTQTRICKICMLIHHLVGALYIEAFTLQDMRPHYMLQTNCIASLWPIPSVTIGCIQCARATHQYSL